MSLPNPGNSISLSQINTELGRSSTAQISLNTAEDSGYVTINGCSQFRPRAANPAKMSEWFKYNHTQPCFTCYNGSNAITQAFTTTNDVNQAVHFYYPISFSSVGESTISLILSNVSGGTVDLVANFAIYYPAFGYFDYWYEGAAYGSNVSSGTFTSAGNGVLTEDMTDTDGIRYIHLSIVPHTNTVVTGNVEIRFSCPTVTTCGNSYTTFAQNCQGQSWHWMDAGTSSRNITLTYTLGGDFHYGAVLTIIDEDDNVIVNGASVSLGTNQTYTFYFTYQGWRNIKILFYDNYSC